MLFNVQPLTVGSVLPTRAGTPKGRRTSQSLLAGYFHSCDYRPKFTPLLSQLLTAVTALPRKEEKERKKENKKREQRGGTGGVTGGFDEEKQLKA